uniref:G_PROTEIN_RECEP_F1_2 domain-containing protein n=1 Tax=Angiostrongylus cantonensis TaxID=6313 RepID=A0A0K0DQT9_ANGCA
MDTDYDNIERVSLHPLLPSILFLNIFELFLLFAAILLNLLFLCVLLQYSVFHIHLRIICLHMTSAVTLLTVYSLIRPVANETDDSSSCFFVHVVPTCFCLLFIIFPLVLVIERAIATEKVRRYEDFHFPSGMMRLCLVFVSCPFIFPFSTCYEDSRLLKALKTNLSQFVLTLSTYVNCHSESKGELPSPLTSSRNEKVPYSVFTLNCTSTRKRRRSFHFWRSFWECPILYLNVKTIVHDLQGLLGTCGLSVNRHAKEMEFFFRYLMILRECLARSIIYIKPFRLQRFGYKLLMPLHFGIWRFFS